MSDQTDAWDAREGMLGQRQGGTEGASQQLRNRRVRVVAEPADQLDRHRLSWQLPPYGTIGLTPPPANDILTTRVSYRNRGGWRILSPVWSEFTRGCVRNQPACSIIAGLLENPRLINLWIRLVYKTTVFETCPCLTYSPTLPKWDFGKWDDFLNSLIPQRVRGTRGEFSSLKKGWFWRQCFCYTNLHCHLQNIILDSQVFCLDRFRKAWTQAISMNFFLESAVAPRLQGDLPGV
jgi:hypothetical protein